MWFESVFDNYTWGFLFMCKLVLHMSLQSMYLPIVLCCGMQRHCLPTNYDINNVVSDTSNSVPGMKCVSVPFSSYINIPVSIVLVVARRFVYKLWDVVVKFIACVYGKNVNDT